MENLLDTLEAQHQAIRTIVAAIESSLAAGDVANVRVELGRLKVSLLAHLDIEDAHLYPALTKAASRPALDVPSRIAVTYEKNMQHVSEALRAFLERYAQRDSDVEELRRDWHLVARMLIERMESEEEQLYPLYLSWVVRRELS